MSNTIKAVAATLARLGVAAGMTSLLFCGPLLPAHAATSIEDHADPALLQVGPPMPSWVAGQVPEVQTILLRADDPAKLRDRADAVRAQLLQTHGVADVKLMGLNQTRLWVEFQPKRLARFGLTERELLEALPVDTRVSTPGHLALRVDVPSPGLQAVADTRVRGQRLGDMAMICREKLEPPVSTLRVEGQPAVELVVLAAR